MVTDAVSTRERTSISYVGRLLLTLFLLALYVYGRRLPLPGVNRAALMSLPIGRYVWNVSSLGLSPLLTGFVLVEVYSLLTPPGRRLRQLGAIGRARLNRAALITSLLLTGIQAAWLAFWLETMPSPGGGAIVDTPGLPFVLLMVVTLTVATAALFILCQLISSYGIGNGFALLILLNIVLAFLGAKTPQTVELILIAGMIAVTFYFIRTAENAWLPAFPQGIIPLYLMFPVLPLVMGLSFLPLSSITGSMTSAIVGSILITIPLFSWLTFHMFSSRRRLQASLSDPDELLDEIAVALRRRTVAATALLVLSMVAFVALQVYRSAPPIYALRIVDIIMTVAIVLDLWDQFRFQWRHGETARLVQLDNVHFSYRLEERLQEEGIAALARGHQFRSLFFLFGALFKIDVLVPVADLGRAREILAMLEMAREVEVF